MKSFRTYISIFLTLAFSAGLIYQTFTVICFYANRAEITEKYCINKEKPEKKCLGKCHLEKQLSGSSESKNPDSKAAIQPISFWFFAVEILDELRIERFCFYSEKNDDLLPQKTNRAGSSRFIPPDFS